MSRRHYNDKFLNNVDLRKPLSDHPIWKDVRGVWLPVPQLSGGSTLYDLSPYGNHASQSDSTKMPAWVATDRGLALDFDGTNDVLQLASSITMPASGWTLSQHILSGVASLGVGFGNGTTWPSQYVSPYGAQCYIKDASSNGTIWPYLLQSIPADVLHHLTVTHDGTTTKLYQDSVLYDTATGIADTITWNYLGKGYGNTSVSVFDGRLLMASVSNRALSPNEVATLYDQSLRGYPDLIRRIPTIKYFFPAASHTFYDTFVDTAGTSLDAHTPDIGSNWTEQQGNFTIKTSGEVAIQ